jgi:hypothetical protein
MTCRLPQTPRTPTTAAAHYFDDIFTQTGRPKKPMNIRRSSTTRSIGYRSDYASTNGDDDDDDEVNNPIKRSNSIGVLDEEALKERAKVDQHVAHYISDQLERVKSGDSGDVDGGEFETSLDGAIDERPTDRKRNGGGSGSYFDEDPVNGK